MYGKTKGPPSLTGPSGDGKQAQDQANGGDGAGPLPSWGRVVWVPCLPGQGREGEAHLTTLACEQNHTLRMKTLSSLTLSMWSVKRRKRGNKKRN